MSKKENKIKIFSALEVANMCGVVNQTAINWIKNGYLKAFTTPGGQYRVYAENLIDFLQKRGMRIPEVLLPYISGSEKQNKILIADTDNEFLEQLKNQIRQDCPDCQILVTSNGIDTALTIAKEKPAYVIASDNIREITPLKLKELGIVSVNQSDMPAAYKIIYIAQNNDDGKFSEAADFVVTRPVEAAKISSYILSLVKDNR